MSVHHSTAEVWSVMCNELGIRNSEPSFPDFWNGVLCIGVCSSEELQDLAFAKNRILKWFRERTPNSGIEDIRFKVHKDESYPVPEEQRTKTREGRQPKPSYSEKLKDPRWQKLRLQIFERDQWKCQICGDDESTLNVHHRWYDRGAEPWEASPECLVTLCETCHENESNNRRDEEQALLNALKRRYWAHDLRQIVKIFEHMPLKEVNEVQLSAVAWMLSDGGRIELMLCDFWDRGGPLPGQERGNP